MTTHSQMGIHKPNPKYYPQAFLVIHSSPSPVPKDPIRALRDPNWKSAMQEEYIALIENNIWDLVPRLMLMSFVHYGFFDIKLIRMGHLNAIRLAWWVMENLNRRVLIAMRHLVQLLNLHLFNLY